LQEVVEVVMVLLTKLQAVEAVLEDILLVLLQPLKVQELFILR
jgi:hypothetical protein